ncbi:MAG: amidase, partial [Paracoccaceae bacterium]
MTDLALMPLTALSAAMADGSVTSTAATEACLARIAETEPVLNAFVTVLGEAARAAAAEADRERAEGKIRGPLHGVPVALKDLLDLEGERTTASSAQWADRAPASADSAVAARLKAAGAVIVGKTHTHEFAYGIATPTTGNPWDPSRIPGGSSGGSAATVAVGGAAMGIGTDTGGSIRIPAALCGLVGLKPSFGRVSRVGCASLSWSLDHIGPITRTVADAALSLDALAGYDPRDPGALAADAPVAGSELGRGVEGLRIGLPTSFFFRNVEDAVAEAARRAAERLSGEGAEIVELAIPHADEILAVEYAICLPEASAYHLERLRSSPEKFTDDVRTFLEAGALLPATTYIQALRLRAQIKAAFGALFERVDAILAPTVAAAAVPRRPAARTWPAGAEAAGRPVDVRHSAPAHVPGLPAVSVPAGRGARGLPLGGPIMGPARGAPRRLGSAAGGAP